MADSKLEDEMPSLDSLTTWGLGTVFLACSLVLYGDMSLTVFGTDVVAWLTTNIVTLGSTSTVTVQYAHVLSLISIAGVYIGTAQDLQNFSDHQGLLGIGTATAVIILALAPPLNEFATATQTRSIILVVLMTVGFISIVEAKDKAKGGLI